jgi:Zn/Cd-binding protein ZinT
MRKKWFFLILLLSMVPAQAGIAADTVDLTPWQGVYVSRKMVIDRPEMAPVYEQTALEARKTGKNYTGPEVKRYLGQLFRTDFSRLAISGNRIAFYTHDSRLPSEEHAYRFAGCRDDRFMGDAFQWFAFEAVDPSSDDTRYRYLLLLKSNRRNGGPPHFHIRYGAAGFKDLLTHPRYADWWPTLLPENLDMELFRSTWPVRDMASMLPSR